MAFCYTNQNRSLGEGAHVGQVDGGGGPIRDIGHVADRPGQSDLDVGEVRLEDGIDHVVSRKENERIGGTQIESVEEVRAVILTPAERLHMPSASSRV